MKKFRILSLVMALALCFGLLAGCGDSGSSGNTTPSGSNSSNTGAPSDNGTPSDSGSTGGSAASGTFVLGGIGPLTGEAAIYGTAAMTGAQIAVEEINALGGPIQFEFTAEDDVSDPSTSVNAYNNLMDNGMQILVGCVTTGPSISVSDLVNEDRVFMLTPSASSADVTAGKDNVFQMCFTDPNQGIASAQYMAENLADAKIAVIYRNDDAYSQGIRDTFVAEAGTQGLNIVYEGTFTKDTQTDFNVQLTGAQSAGADLIYLPIYYQPSSVIFNQANSMGYTPAFFGVDGMDGILTMPNFDTSLAEGVMLLTPFSATLEDERTQNFVAEYQARMNGETPNQFAADGYDCVYALYEAIQAAGINSDMSTEEICDALVATFTSSDFSFTGLTGSEMTWGTNGEVSKAPMAFVIKDGVYVLP